MIRADRQSWKSPEVSRLLALFETERHYYQEIVAGLPSGLVVVGPDLKAVSANRRFFEILDVRHEDVLGRPLRDLLPVEGLTERVAEVLSSGIAARDILLEAPAKEGVRLLLAGISVLKPADGTEAGEVENILLAVEDLSSVGRLEFAPKGGEPQPPALLDNLGAIVWEREPATFKFTYVNRCAQDMLGFENRQWLEDPDFWRQRIHAEDRDLVMDFYRDAATEGAERECEYRVLAADGRTVWLREIIGVPSAPEGKPDRLCGLMLDVTRGRADREQSFRSQKLEALARLAGRMAHDFNNQLMVITGYAQEIAGELEADDPLQEAAEEILTAADRSTELTRLLLTYARRQVMEPRSLDLNAMLLGLEGKLKSLLGESVDLKLALDPALGKLKTDPWQLEQAILNLATNAREAIVASGEVGIETRQVTVTAERGPDAPAVAPGHYAELAVRDNGRGMDSETRSHLFEPFFSTKDAGRAGLSLAALYGIVKQGGGDVQVDSTPGAGSTFRIYLPVEAPAEQPAPAPPTPVEVPKEPEVQAETVLLVEEEGGIRTLVRKILQRNGYRVLEAGSSEDALAIAAAHEGPLELLITDMVLSGTSGRDLEDTLSQTRPDIKTIYVFGYTDNDVALAARLPENAAYLQKPFSLETLLKKVRELLGTVPEAGTATQ